MLNPETKSQILSTVQQKINSFEGDKDELLK